MNTNERLQAIIQTHNKNKRIPDPNLEGRITQVAVDNEEADEFESRHQM